MDQDIPSFDVRVHAVAAAADAWRDPEHQPRAEAVEKTLKAPNRFTEEETAFTINQRMHELQPEAIRTWIGGRQAERPVTVGGIPSDDVPLSGLEDFLVVVLIGHRYRGALSAASPYLLPAFAAEVQHEGFPLSATFKEEPEEIAVTTKAVIANQSVIQEMRSDLRSRRWLVREPRFAAAVIDGNESADEREGLAEDMLLHDGRGHRSVRLLFAPAELEPDPYLEAMAAFRAVFPAHADLAGALQMQQAFLEAADQAHAYAEGLPFLMSRGAPEVQRPGHVRWSTYDDRGDVHAWLTNHADSVSLVVAREALAQHLPDVCPMAPPGHAHRPALGGRHRGHDAVEFLMEIARRDA